LVLVFFIVTGNSKGIVGKQILNIIIF